MEFTRIISAAEMLRKVGTYLEEKEVQHNLPLGVLRQLKREEEDRIYSSPFLALGTSQQGTEVMLIQTPPRRMIVCGNPEAMAATADWLQESGFQVPGIVGCEQVAAAFADAWREKTGRQAVIVKKQFIYELHEVKSCEHPPGRLTLASEDDVALVMDWTETFAMGSLRHEDLYALENLVTEEIRRNQVFFWRDKDYTPVSMAKRARDLTNGIVVNYIYTPEEYERKGYATACVGALAERMLQEGYQFCSVNTNVENEASINVYKKLGFETAGLSLEYEFK